MSEPWIQKGRTWLEEHQNADGGWGETVASYDDPSLRGQGTTTASQTAWALLGLCAFPDVNRRSVREGIEYLVSNQNPDGSWSETLITGTGFPLVFYLKYDMYRNTWPLMALARYQTRLAEAASRSVEPEEVLQDRGRSEVSFASTRSSFSSLPVFVLLRDLLTKLNHG
jgi:squalene-hopene/tetraprenyl-beta-curcumene cyclase